MSYTTQSFFEANAGQIVNVWLRSNDFEPKVGVGTYGAANAGMQTSSNAWLYNSSFRSAALRYTASTDGVYVVNSTSTTDGKSGSFQLYISPGEVSSIVPTGNNSVGRVICPAASGRVFITEQDYGIKASSYVTVINSQQKIIENEYQILNTNIIDSVYNSVNDTIWVWLSGSSGEFFYEYNSSGSSLIASHSVSTQWWPLPEPSTWLGTSYWGYLAYNPVDNHILMCPANRGLSSSFVSYKQPLTNSIYDCNTHTIINQYVRTTDYNIWPVYVSSSHTYYVFGNYTSEPTTKINASTFTTTSIAHMTGSSQGGAYVSFVDRIFLQNPAQSSCSVYNPSSDNLVDSIPGIVEMNQVIYCPCGNAIIIADDSSSGDYLLGGLCYLDPQTLQPINFITIEDGPSFMDYCATTSTIFVSNLGNKIIREFFVTHPTASLPPFFPSYCISAPFQAYAISGSTTQSLIISR